MALTGLLVGDIGTRDHPPVPRPCAVQQSGVTVVAFVQPHVSHVWSADSEGNEFNDNGDDAGGDDDNDGEL